jgi:hypothetical protein
MAEEGFSHEDALILSYASFGFDALGEIFGVEIVRPRWLARATPWRSLRWGGLSSP